MQKQRQIGPFRASKESFVPRMRRGRVCVESFVPEVGPCDSCWESFVPHMRQGRVSQESFVPEVGPPLGPGAGLLPLMRTAAGLSVPPAFSTPVAVGVLRHTKPSCGVSPACRTLAWRNSPRLAAPRPRFEVV